MQERITQCLINESNIAESEFLNKENSLYTKQSSVALVNDEEAFVLDFEDLAELASGYAECMAEAVRYLTQVENYPEHHPAVVALERHLAASYRGRLFGRQQPA